MAVLAAAVGGAAYADCAPPSGSTVCSGVTTGQLTVDTSRSVTVRSDASLTAAGGDTAAILVTSTGPGGYSGATTTADVTIAGQVDGGSSVGVLVGNDTTTPYYNQTTANIVVGSNGVVRGATAIRLAGGNVLNYYGRSMANLDNYGDIRSTSGAALVASPVDRTAFLKVTNHVGGFIGGVNGTVQTLDNQGVIDGGADSALGYLSGNYAVWGGSWTNTGTIRSSSAAATINPASGPSIVNSGLIINTGTGAAIATPGGVTIENKAGGVIQGNGVAIDGRDTWGGMFRLTNRGEINGSVLVSTFSEGAIVDNGGGVINGDLVFGGAADTLVVSLGANGLDYGTITGRLDGGGGDNKVQLRVASDQTVGASFSSLSLPTNFNRYQILLSHDAVLTFNGDVPDGVTLSGQGKLVSNGVVNTTGTAFSTYYLYEMDLSFHNEGEITAQLQIPPGTGPYLESAYAISLRSVSDFLNSGTITAIGGHGVLVSQDSYPQKFVNAGTITASGYALTLSGAFTNDGRLRSTAGAALQLDLGGGGARTKISTNNGTIEGVTAGAVLQAVTFVNNGAVTASDGYGVAAGFWGSLDNRAGGVVTGSKGSVVGASSNFLIRNAGTLNGDVNLASGSSYDTSPDTFIDDGGQLKGSLYLGGGDDYFVAAMDRTSQPFAGVTGAVDAGEGKDTLILRMSKDTTASLASFSGFETLGLAISDDAAVKLTADQALASTLQMGGIGSLDLTADITTTSGALISMNGLRIDPLYGVATNNAYNPAVMKLSVVSRGALSVVQPDSGYWVQGVAAAPGVDFENAGTLTANGGNGYYAVSAISGGDKIINSGTISLSSATGVSGATTFVNTGQLTQTTGGGTSYGVQSVVNVDNSGTISTGGTAIAFNQSFNAPNVLTNSGVIASTAGTAVQASYADLTVTNTADGVITGAGTAIFGSYYIDTVFNGGVVNGGVDLAGSDDWIENHGTINGDVALGDGNDTFVQWVSGKMNGAVDGGNGLDTLVIDSTGGGTISTSRFVNFESFKQIGGGSLNYVGDFGTGPIILENSAAVVLAGDSVTTTGGVAFSGGAGSEHVTVEGSISDGVSLGDGVDTVINHGAIGGSIALGAGDDSYTEGFTSTVTGAISGGAGADTYILELAGNRNGLHGRGGFENLGVTGAGTLTLALDQNWNSISLAGANVHLTSGAHTIGALSGGEQNEAVRIDADIAQVALGGGADNLQVEFTQLAGAYSGGAGTDTVRFTAATPVTVAGSLRGFETIALDGGQMAVSGALGATGETTTFHGDAAQTLSILAGGALSGTVDLGAGDDVFALAAGGQLAGMVLGGAGADKAVVDLTSDLSLRGDQLQQFETLQVTGTGALNFTGGAARFDHLITTSRDLTVGAGSTLAAGDLALSGGDNTMTVSGAFSGALDLGAGDDHLRLTTGGTFTGSAQGGAGFDSLELALGGTDAAPIALGGAPFNGFEALSLQSGVVSVAGDYGFDTIRIQNGRLIGLAGSRLTASNITVAQGAIFGSAGSVTGDIAVAGTLSPGASPGTMTVTGNVALAAGSTALFEFTPTLGDQLVVSGTVTIAQGSTLKLTGAAALTPGRRLDLITAAGGIVGSFSTIDGAQGLNLHIEQSTNRLQALGLFTTDTTFSPQVSTLIGQFNTALVDNAVSASLIAALPALVDPATGKSDPRALAKVTPQAYASANQLAVEDGLTIVDASRAQARFAPDAPGLFGFGQAIASRRTLDGDAALGVTAGKIDTTGGLSGVGYGLESAWGGVFVGYLNGRQRINDLDVRTGTDSFVIGAQGQVRLGGFLLGAMAAHDSADVDTRRTAPGGTTATGDYKLKSWIADVNLSYRGRLNDQWAVQPRLGASHLSARRDGLVERGGGALALTVHGDQSSAWFVDGQVEVLGGQAAGARLHPYAALGFRSTADGGDTAASARLTGFSTPISAVGLNRGGTLALVGGGATYDLAKGLTLSATYAGEFGDGGRQAMLAGLNWKF